MIPVDTLAPHASVGALLPDLLGDLLIALAGDDYAAVLRQCERLFGRIADEPGDLTALHLAIGLAVSAFCMRGLRQPRETREGWAAVVTSLEAVIEAELASLLRRAR